ncbi:oxidative stress-induced growth inhibitor 1 [Tachyglossus aculeatus]|uniref:oxidative stress-induced growth inhibitor 1 n=1 Tax=Tachyglossus aculeatus TaxID=9261 RepID=UPI0018F74AEB|nr:oxidative stress-induced growth inhibitor 1 [Tachyglossus aculeatus]XP_038628364.1 oxidative stress-induced growth inhibitor 1 [Tachyglossus aculeatus]XP_038628366.1 oxidative stress-induced growth inhibitor 1 [Tachyglossus aculeatus]XP_038628367.1 oxidative stress-induced growth inhibitor 1 [Tachyglossus aculeatus]XP_038628368.1 oxidative stress-induced growth inhibitor 1 [Tachyglossus aculeatus]XP_038628369.1 oxidative stress-induced growth inhibitor 1 [Tachyglossus aculeatus]
MSSVWKEHPSLSSTKPLPVVIIGNGPSGICLSYLLSGNIPYVRRDAVHPHPILQKKLEETPEVSIIDQDLEYLSEGLEGRCYSPVALLFDTLLRPDTDIGGNAESVLTWWHQESRAIPHLVLGKNLPGGAWHSIEGSMITLSQGEWMGLPDLQFKDWMKKKRRGFRNSRATAGDIAHYYQNYVMKKGLCHNFHCGSTVTAVRRVGPRRELGSSPDCFSDWSAQEPAACQATPDRQLFQVSGFMAGSDGSQRPFSISAENVVLATGTYDSPSWLGISGEDLPFVHHELSVLETSTKDGTLDQTSDPVLIVGAGLSAADAVLFARHCNVPVIHAFRRKVDDPGLIFNQLPKMMYPEYHKVHQMMREQSILTPGSYEGYLSLPEHQLLFFKDDKRCVFQDGRGQQKVFSISLALLLIGSNPNLSFLPNNGANLAVDPLKPVNPKRNPIDVAPFTYECVQEPGLYALGPLAGDNFVRFVQGGALAVASSLLRREKKNPT